jgi:hypothetical protein
MSENFEKEELIKVWEIIGRLASDPKLIDPVLGLLPEQKEKPEAREQEKSENVNDEFKQINQELP